MSASYSWIPAPKPPERGESFEIGLADMLTRWLVTDPGPHLPANRSLLAGAVLDSSHLDWLAGVAAAASGQIQQDAEALAAGIHEHGAIQLRVER